MWMQIGVVVNWQGDLPIICCKYVGDSLIASKSKKQATMARSSAEAEYRALAIMTTELLWVKKWLQVFEVKIASSMVLCDSKSAIQLTNILTTHERLKHIDIDCHFLREHVQSGFLNLIHVRTQQQLANILTKTLPKATFPRLDPPIRDVGICVAFPLLCSLYLTNQNYSQCEFITSAPWTTMCRVWFSREYPRLPSHLHF